MIVPARRRAPRNQNYRSVGRRGLGFSYNDLLAQTDREDCDPRDSACVGRNQQQVNAVQELWNASYLGKTDAQMGPLPKLDIRVDTSDRATQAFMNNQPVDAGISISGGPTYSGAQLQAGIPRVQSVAPVPVVSLPVAPGTVQTQTTTPTGQLVVTSSGAQNAVGSSGGAPAVARFSLASIPLWGWAAAAGVAVFAFGGGHGR